MNGVAIAGIVSAVVSAPPGAYVAYRIGMRHANIEEREAGVEERRVAVEERQLDAAIRDELRSANVGLQTQVASLTNDNARVHKALHDVRNEMMVMQGTMLELTTDRAQCRRDLAEVLLAVDALEQGRDRMARRLDQLEEDADG